jgi:lysine 2,3-aminomutase
MKRNKTKRPVQGRTQPFLCTPHFMRLIRLGGEPLRQCRLRRQVEVDERELLRTGLTDPLAEEHHTPIPGLVHRYPDRVLLLPTFECFSHCRFCTRKRKWGEQSPFFANQERIFRYISKHDRIAEAIISGGDPLTLSDAELGRIIGRLARISHVKVLRVATRCLTFQPGRITARTARILGGFPVVYFTAHFNHPAEITDLARKKCLLLRRHGLILINQSVLLKGVNDDLKTLKALCRGLLEIGIKPYALHQLDLTVSTQHFKVPLKKGLRLISSLRKDFTGIGIPHYVLDRPGGKGKIFPSTVDL